MKNYFKINKNFLFLFLIFGAVIFLSGINIRNTVLALTGDYDRASSGNNEINEEDWDNLDVDFLATDGSNVMNSGANIVLSGGGNVKGLPDVPVNNNDAASKVYVNSRVASGITNTGGETLKMVCGTTPYAATTWQVTGDNTVGIKIDTSAANFVDNNEVFYTASLYGDDGMYQATGMSNIYLDSGGGFWLYLSQRNGGTFNVSTINNSWHWYVRWCGVGK